MADDSNSTTEPRFCVFGKSKQVEITLAVSYSIIAMLGIIGNALVINVVRQNRHMRTITNIMLVNIAVSDILSLIWSLPKRYFDIMDAHPSDKVGKWLCKFVTANNMAAITLAVSVYTLSLLAFERYHSLVKPFQPPRINENNVVYVLAATWVTASVAQIPTFIETTFNEVTCSCESPWTSNDTARSMRDAVVIIITVNIFFPIIVISFCYALVINALYFNKANRVRTFDPSDLQSKKKIVRLLMIVTVVFYACFLPFGLYMMILASNYADKLSDDGKYSLSNGFEVVKFLMITH